MTSLDRALAEQRHLRTLAVLREMERQLQMRAEGQTVQQVCEALGLDRATVFRRQRWLKQAGRKGINRKR